MFTFHNSPRIVKKPNPNEGTSLSKCTQRSSLHLFELDEIWRCGYMTLIRVEEGLGVCRLSCYDVPVLHL